MQINIIYALKFHIKYGFCIHFLQYIIELCSTRPSPPDEQFDVPASFDAEAGCR